MRPHLSSGIFALVTMLMATVVIAHANDNCRREHIDTQISLCDSSVSRTIADSGDIMSLSVEVRASLARVKERAGMSDSYWGLSLSAPGDTLTVKLRFGNTDYGDFLDRRIALLTVSRNGNDIYSGEAKGFRMSSGQLNSLSLSLDEAHTLFIYGGGERTSQIADICLDKDFHPDDISVWSVGQLTVTVFSTEVCPRPSVSLASGYTQEWLDNHFAKSRDPLEGYWSYFDRATDPRYAKPGGRYTLAVVRETPESYRIIYISGATVMADKWQPLMLKGGLQTTIFQGNYNLSWIDSTFGRISEDCHATLDSDNSLLTLSFPLLKSTLRFSKVPMGHSDK